MFLTVGTVSGMDPGISMSMEVSVLSAQLSALGSQLAHLQVQVEGLLQENIEDKEQIVQLKRRVSLLESACGSTQMETEISGPLLAIGGYDNVDNSLISSAEVLNTTCDFPLPEARTGHMSVTTTDGKTLVCGGRVDTTRSSGYKTSDFTASCLQFDYESKSWKEHSQLLSVYRFYASTVTLSRGTYVLGGRRMTPATSSSEFLATGSSLWTQGPRIPGEGI